MKANCLTFVVANSKLERVRSIIVAMLAARTVFGPLDAVHHVSIAA